MAYPQELLRGRLQTRRQVATRQFAALFPDQVSFGDLVGAIEVRQLVGRQVRGRHDEERCAVEQPETEKGDSRRRQLHHVVVSADTRRGANPGFRSNA